MDTLDDALTPIGSHRCDRCPAPAQGRLSTARGPLYLCGHHTNRLPAELAGWISREETHA